MEAIREIAIAPRPRDTRRWAICIALALGIHAAGAAALIARWNAEPDQVANAPVIMIELETLPVAPETKPAEQPPGPQQQQSTATPERPKPLEKTAEAPPLPQHTDAPLLPTPQKPVEQTAAMPPELKAELQFAAAPPPKSLEKPTERPVEKRVEKPVEKKHRQKQASLSSAPSSAEIKAERAAAPTPGASSRNPDAVPNWKSQLVARLERAKRYPSEAQSRGEQGVAQLAFSVDRSGGVHHARIVRSSGSGLLDEATLALVERAAPLPAPPSEISGAQIAISVPIRYNMR
jgi:protein TonB